ncbi:sphinganine kinase [Saccharomycopsis crataegensis]|uniref:Sphinganine kinase n=1 Tax=Saccharomycopsis crataegensis TaxID=43959 RepID=A0AAV5QX06_9ASCO|nr:sphinganine kinase [Saccharomycopsis crataegensis]
MGVADLLTNTQADAGNKSDSYYKLKLSPLRYKLRAMLLPIIAEETRMVFKIQKRLRCDFLDVYFAWSANLASHTFYVIMLPLPFWFGFVEITRDLVWVLGFGIFISGVAKDYFCLPRPQSPPLHRITMSGYTAKEYGFPSSHSANATSVTMVLFYYYLQFYFAEMGWFPNLAVSLFVVGYCVSLMFGRVYCGMHGFMDVLGGTSIGVFCFISRLQISKIWDPLLTSDQFHWWLPVGVVVFVGLSVHFHAQPVDDCPCFDDSVAFIGVLLGLELSNYYMAKYDYFKQVVDPAAGVTSTVTLPYSFESLGWFKTIARVVVGVGLVVVWKAVSKKFFLRLLTPVYGMLGVYIPRNFVNPVSLSNESYDNIYQSSMKRLDEDEVADFPKFVKSITQRPTQVEDQQGDNPPESIGTHKKHDDDGEEAKGHKGVLETCGALKPRYDVEIVTRLIVYAGIPCMATVGFAVAVKLLGLDYQPYKV